MKKLNSGYIKKKGKAFSEAEGFLLYEVEN